MSESPTTPIVPDDFDVPQTLTGQGFRLEPLTVEHNEQDFAAWYGSRAHIHATPGFAGRDWPTEDYTLELNEADLAEHQRDFAARIGFTYTVLDPGSSGVIGCLYLYPPKREGYDVDVRSWVVAQRAELDQPLYAAGARLDRRRLAVHLGRLRSPVKTLVLLRHAKSDWDGHEADIDRPLAPRGRREAPDAGRWLAQNLPTLDRAVVSPALRTAETWQLVSEQLTVSPYAMTDDRVYAASAADLLTVVRELPDEVGTVLLVGHNPGLEDLVRLLSGELVAMPTSAIAVLAVDVAWSAVMTADLTAAGRPPVRRA